MELNNIKYNLQVLKNQLNYIETQQSVDQPLLLKNVSQLAIKLLQDSYSFKDKIDRKELSNYKKIKKELILLNLKSLDLINNLSINKNNQQIKKFEKIDIKYLSKIGEKLLNNQKRNKKKYIQHILGMTIANDLAYIERSTKQKKILGTLKIK